MYPIDPNPATVLVRDAVDTYPRVPRLLMVEKKFAEEI